MATARYKTFSTPVGTFVLIAEDGQLRGGWSEIGEPMARGARRDDTLEPGLSERLERYFAGERVSFDDVAVPPGPPFAGRCWEACRRIPRGETVTYGDLAAAAGNPRGARAAGQAMRRNPLAVVVPCHRVIASGGGLHGYAGSCDHSGRSIGIKRWLLSIEKE